MVAETRRGPVLVIGHLPPPVHGMAVATSAFAELLEAYAPVVRLKTTGNELGRTIRQQCTRLLRTGQAVLSIFRWRHDGRSAYFSVDAGPGIIYTITVVAAARILSYPLAIHHHSYAYVRQSSRLMQLLVLIAGPAGLHLVACTAMKGEFDLLYPRAGRVTVLSLDFLTDKPVPLPLGGRPLNDRPTLGFLSNITLEKGIAEVFDTLDSARMAGIDACLVTAGPVISPEADALLQRRLQLSEGHATHLGPVHGSTKESFFQGIDVFLFPSAYSHESFGIVVREALGHGIPVIAYEGGCLRKSVTGDGAIILTRNEPFATAATSYLRRWFDNPDDFRTISRIAAADARARWDRSRGIAESLAYQIANPGRRDCANMGPL